VVNSRSGVLSWLNGQPSSSIALDDRGLAFGDGLFETLLINNSSVTLLAYHLERLLEGAHALRLSLDPDLVAKELRSFIASYSLSQGVLKLIVTRGSGPRGYAVAENSQLNRVLLFYPAAKFKPFAARSPVIAELSRLKLAPQAALSGIKHLNRLEQVLAKTKGYSQSGCSDSILLDINGNVIETVSSNLFFFSGDQLLTPDLSLCGVNGTVRRLILAELEMELGIKVLIRRIKLSQLRQASLVFSTNSVRGVQRIQCIGLWSYPGDTVGDHHSVEQQFLRIAHWVDAKLGYRKA